MKAQLGPCPMERCEVTLEVIIVPQEPSRAGIDPYRKLIERERDDNVVEVETGC